MVPRAAKQRRSKGTAARVALPGRQSQVIARREVDATRRPPADRPPALVVRKRLLHTGGAEARFPRAKTELDVLEGKEVGLVKKADPLDHFAPDQHHASADCIDQRYGGWLESGQTAACAA